MDIWPKIYHIVLPAKKEGATETITITCADGVTPVDGETVKARVKSGKNRVSVSPPSATTDASGQAVFTITATDKTGNARVEFKDKTAGLKTTVKVKVAR